jgi:hypothetical protein
VDAERRVCVRFSGASDEFKRDAAAHARCTPSLPARGTGACALSAFVHDEAHCIVQMGFEFRSSYLALGLLRVFLPEVPIMVLTATASPDMALNIGSILQLRRPMLLRGGLNRASILWETERSSERAPKGQGTTCFGIGATRLWLNEGRWMHDSSALHSILLAVLPERHGPGAEVTLKAAT